MKVAVQRYIPRYRVYYGLYSVLFEPGVRKDFAWRCWCGFAGIGLATRTSARIAGEHHRAALHPRWSTGTVRRPGT